MQGLVGISAWAPLESLLDGGELAQERLEGLYIQRGSGSPVALVLQPAGVQLLLDVTSERHRQHGHPQPDRLAHQREPASGHHRPRRAQVLDEALLREGSPGDIALLAL
jgi:hypothetical protein